MSAWDELNGEEALRTFNQAFCGGSRACGRCLDRDDSGKNPSKRLLGAKRSSSIISDDDERRGMDSGKPSKQSRDNSSDFNAKGAASRELSAHP
ncbi:hypothetical protein RB2447 [Rhodopirellula baltica SH 1]|uniref:Uncharacterized protein n=1 Tax=Rhodopirellula baltica (strain DSM 10527 / NCIMB 13988 / SH1) TaxID=243090 RepID=Q7UVU0_RHOBA|nr:hypothetical protein RB2447 [Rhodopirellula baltica SH 1]